MRAAEGLSLLLGGQVFVNPLVLRQLLFLLSPVLFCYSCKLLVMFCLKEMVAIDARHHRI